MKYVAVTQGTLLGVIGNYQKKYVLINPNFPEHIKKYFELQKIRFAELPSDNDFVAKRLYVTANKIDNWLSINYQVRDDWATEDELKNPKLRTTVIIDNENYEQFAPYLNSPFYDFYAVKGSLDDSKITEEIKICDYKDIPCYASRNKTFSVKNKESLENWIKTKLLTQFYTDAIQNPENADYIQCYYEALKTYIETNNRTLEYGDTNDFILKYIEEHYEK